MSYVTKCVTSATFPFIWDDPNTADDVSQLAVDLGNGAVRGKGTEEPRVPATGCLVTANFNMAESLKYFSRILLLKVERSARGKTAGNPRELETLAHAASSSFPMVMGMLNKLNADDVHAETEVMQGRINADIRIVEGVSLQIHIARKLLNLCGRGHYMGAVDEYVTRKLLPYYRHILPAQPHPDMAVDQGDVIALEDVTKATASLIKRGTVLAVTYEAVNDVDGAKAMGGRLNRPTKFHGKVRKMIHLPKIVFTVDKWDLIYAKMTAEDDPIPAPPVATPEREQRVPAPIPRVSSPTLTVPSPTPTVPSPTLTVTSPMLTVPSPTLTVTSPTLTVTSPTLTVTSPMLTVPSSTLTVTSPTLTVTSPTLTVTSPTLTVPSSTLTVTSPTLTVTSPTLTVTSPTLTVPSSTLTVTSPTLTVSSPTPTVPSPTLTVPSPTLTVTSPTPRVPSPKHTPKRGLTQRTRRNLLKLVPEPVAQDSAKIVCNYCRKVGRANWRWAECDRCITWYHAKCQGINTRQYENITEGETWFCDLCFKSKVTSN